MTYSVATHTLDEQIKYVKVLVIEEYQWSKIDILGNLLPVGEGIERRLNTYYWVAEDYTGAKSFADSLYSLRDSNGVIQGRLYSTPLYLEADKVEYQKVNK